jgi:hypothetical protein
MKLALGTTLALGLALLAPGARAATTGHGLDRSLVVAQATPTDNPPATTNDPNATPGTVDEPMPPPATQPTTPSDEGGATRRGSTYTTDAPYMTPTSTRAEHPEPGYSVTAGGGVLGFTKSAARDLTDNVGGDYTARLAIGTRAPVALELGYIGSAMGIKSLGVSNNAVLLGNGAEGELRINMGAATVQPYVHGGAAWRHYSLTNSNFNASSLNDSDNVIEFPVGAGVALHAGGLVLDARGAYRFTTNENLLRSASGGGNLNLWEATLKAGVEF